MSGTETPEPYVAGNVDLRDFPFTPMFRSRLFGSSFHARVSDAGWRAGVTLWLKSWDQVPAGTLPDDEVDLCRLAELGRELKTWRRLAKEALWGWVKCSDGRLHHETVAQGVNEAWTKKKEQRARTEAARQARAAKRLSQTAEFSVADENGLCDRGSGPSVTSSVTASKGREGKGREIQEGKIEEAETLSVQTERTKIKPFRTKYPSDFLALWADYPTDPNMSKKEAYEVWKRLPDAERDAAVKSIPAFKIYCRDHPNYSVVHLCRYLSKQRAEGFLESAERLSEAPKVYLKPGCRQWDAWTQHRGKSPPLDKDGGWSFPTEWPPTTDDYAGSCH